MKISQKKEGVLLGTDFADIADTDKAPITNTQTKITNHHMPSQLLSPIT
jgi:hypothetical protein